jgi:arylsulfatase A-like enzyme
MRSSCLAIVLVAWFLAHGWILSTHAQQHPNILWLTSEDHGPAMGCYGDALARTPNVDALAAKGMRFRTAWSVAPVCAPARTAIITGIYPSSIGGLHMRSMVSLPDYVRAFPQFLQDAGYYCTNHSKTDYNVRFPSPVWSESSNKAHWRKRRAGQPFFAVFNSTKSHESQIRARPHTLMTDPAQVRLPSYHPDTPEVRRDWAQYYDMVSQADADAGSRLEELENAGLAEETIVFYFADHGSGMPRSKRWSSDSGLHVPIVVYFPPKWQHLAPKEYFAGGESDRPVSFVDLAPTMLSLAGIQPPAWMQGHAFAGPFQAPPQPFLFGERGRMDERMDLVRSVTDGRYVYLRNFYPHVSQAQHVAYQFETPTTRVWNQLYKKGSTNAAQSLFWQVPKPVEELYDLETDPDEVVNLADEQEHREICNRLRSALREHVLSTRDVCFFPEREMLARSEGSSPYEVARNDLVYPLSQILETAEFSSNWRESADSRLADRLADSNSVIRYWGALGFLIRGDVCVSLHEKILVGLLDDPSMDVRIVAAQALGIFGSENARGQALRVLASLADPQTQGVMTSIAALAAIEAIGDRAGELRTMIGALKTEGPSPDDRYNSYVQRLIANITGIPSEKED